MATTTVHAQLIRYTTNGDQVVVNLKSTGSDVSIDRSTNTKLPTSVTSAQALADALGSLAFKNSLSKGDVGLGNVDNTADANKSVKYAASAGSSSTAAAISAAGTLDTVDKLNAFIEGGKVKYATVSALDGLDGMIKNDGVCISTPWTSRGYGHQFYINDNGYDLYHRFRNTTKVNNVDTPTWSSWKQILDSSNYNSFAPTKTGGGASGTWGISISGNAASASSVAWGNVSGKPSTFAPSSHTHNYAGSSSAGGAANSANKLTTARAINGVNFDGTAGITITANPTSTNTNNEDLNSVTTPGFYYGGGNNTSKNKPDGVDAFGMIVFKTAGSYTTQVLVEGNSSAGKMWIRQYNSREWSGWNYIYTTAYKPSKSDVGLGNVDNTADSAKSVCYFSRKCWICNKSDTR